MGSQSPMHRPPWEGRGAVREPSLPDSDSRGIIGALVVTDPLRARGVPYRGTRMEVRYVSCMLY